MAGIIWSKEARDDLDTIFFQMEAESRSYAKKWIDELLKKTELLEKFPNMGRQVPEIQVQEIREIFAGRYRVLYKVSKNDTVELLAIRHSAKPLSE